MGEFDDVTLEWAGKAYVIKARDRIEAIGRVEAHITLDELVMYHRRKGLPRAVLSKAFAAVLNYAGAKVTDKEVYLAMLPGGGVDVLQVYEVATLLLMMMMPPESMRKTPGEQTPGNVVPAAGAGAPSRKRSKSRSGRGK